MYKNLNQGEVNILNIFIKIIRAKNLEKLKNIEEHFKNLEKLEQFEAIINSIDSQGYSLLHWAVSVQDLDIVSYLIARNIDVNLRTAKAGSTAMHLAVDKNNIEIVQAISKSQNYKETPDRANKTPLHMASDLGNFAAVKALIDYSNLNAQDDKGFTPLHRAINKNFELTELLLKNGADPDIRGGLGQPPLFITLNKLNVYDIVFAELLIKYCADINVQDEESLTVSDWISNFLKSKTDLDSNFQIKCKNFLNLINIVNIVEGQTTGNLSDNLDDSVTSNFMEILSKRFSWGIKAILQNSVELEKYILKFNKLEEKAATFLKQVFNKAINEDLVELADYINEHQGSNFAKFILKLADEDTNNKLDFFVQKLHIGSDLESSYDCNNSSLLGEAGQLANDD